jgi:hypothetical protein
MIVCFFEVWAAGNEENKGLPETIDNIVNEVTDLIRK